MATGIVSVDLSSAGDETLSRILLAIANVVWLPLVAPVLRHWVTPTVGVSFVLAVSAESIAMLSATLAPAVHAPGLAYAALVPLVLGLGAYVFVLARFDARQLLTGQGDHWVIGGALAISALAAGRIALGRAGLRDAVLLVLWGAAMAWLVVFGAMLRRATIRSG